MADDRSLEKLIDDYDAWTDEIYEKNRAIQEYISSYGKDVPSDLIKLISDLDHVLLMGEKTK